MEQPEELPNRRVGMSGCAVTSFISIPNNRNGASSFSSGKPVGGQSKKSPDIEKNAILCRLKRLAAILLVGILFFNWYGYQLLTQYWQQQAESQLQARLDRNDYDDSQLLAVKVPVTALSYYNYTSSNFERVDGNIDIQGVHYQYVKRRFVKDSLELLCIPNQTTTKLRQVKNDFFRQVNDLQQQTQGKKTPSSPVKDISKDYQPTAMQIVVPGALAALTLSPVLYTCPHLPSSYSPTAEMPPDQAPALS
jgi:hypothetical protein